METPNGVLEFRIKAVKAGFKIFRKRDRYQGTKYILSKKEGTGWKHSRTLSFNTLRTRLLRYSTGVNFSRVDAVKRGMRKWHEGVISAKQKRICEIVERDGFSSCGKITEELYGRGPKYWSHYGGVKVSMTALSRRGYLVRGTGKRTNRSSKYYLTDKRPTAYWKGATKEVE